MKRLYFSKAVILSFLTGSSLTAIAQTTTFSTAGGPYGYTVPQCTFAVAVVANGAAGGTFTPGFGSVAALGGRVTCNLTVTPGQVLNVFVGGVGGNGGTTGVANVPGGINGGGDAFADPNYAFPTYNPGQAGGSGGGSSDIRIGGIAIANRVVVAGGAGGGGANSFVLAGGAGGGLTGGTGATNGGTGGGGGGPSSGGIGGTICCTYTSGTNGVLFQAGVAAAPHPGLGGGGGGGYYGGGGGCWSGGGGGSSYTDPILGTSVVHTQGVNPGDGSVSITANCTPPVAGSILGNSLVCGVGGTLALSNPTAVPATCGVWGSSNTGVATVDPTGLVTTLAAGFTTITYSISLTCGTASTTTVVTVNAATAPITGSTVLCSGLTTTLGDATAGGTWTSGSPAIATAGSAGVVTGLAAGTATIGYTAPGGCAVATVVTVNPLPGIFNVTGGGVFCAGGTSVHIGLSGSASGFNYQLFNGGSPVGLVAGTGSAIDFGLFATTGIYTVVATNPVTGCTQNMTGSAGVTVNPAPAPITGAMNVCVGGTTTLIDATPGGTWSSSNPSQAAIVSGTGVVTGVFVGNPTITYILTSTGCRITTLFLVNPIPSPISGVTNVCVGSTTNLSDLPAGGTWSSSNLAAAVVGPGTGIVTGVNTGISTITYTLATGCNTSTAVAVNGLPVNTYIVTGGGSYCAGPTGVHVDLSFSDIGINYQLLLGGSAIGGFFPGSNSGLDLGAQTSPGTYTVQGTNAITSCTSIMTGSVNVTALPSPLLHNMTGGGSYCAGSAGPAIGIDGSDVGIQYQLYNGVSLAGGFVTGTGGAISFGTFTAAGTYTVIATNPVTGCTASMTGSETITENPLPPAYTVTGGGSYCAGGTGLDVMLSNSDAGNIYQLQLAGVPVGSVTAVGGAIDFGLALGMFTVPGVYTVVGADGTTGCPNNMTGSATIVVNPLPTVYNVTGGGGYCVSGTGVHVGLSFSNTGIQYQLWDGGSSVGAPVPGSGTSLDFGILSAPGTYTVSAVNPLTHCTNNMSGSAVISINLPPISFSITGGGSYCAGSPGVSIGTNLSEVGVSYQLYRGTTLVGTSVAGTGAGINFGVFTTSGTYTVLATNASTGCFTNLTGVAIVALNPLPAVHTVTGGGSFCAEDTGVHVGLNGSDIGINYELWYNSAGTGNVLTGTGSALDFGLQTLGGIYTVVATSSAPCQKNMSGSATVIVNPAPTLYNMIGGGGYCAGGAGLHIGIDGSSTGVLYQLYNGLAMVGSPLTGSGAALDFGAKTALGVYTVWATNMLTGCTALMNGASNVTLNPPPTDYATSGGGDYCIHGTGSDILTTGSDVSTNYQLFVGSIAASGPMAGTGGVVDFGFQTTAGLYTVIATNSLGCSKRMPDSAVIHVISPAVYAITGGGNFCANGTGVVVGQAGSATSETYQLYNSGGITGPVVPGTGRALNFGRETLAGTYYVEATNIALGCTDTMAGTAVVGINPLPVVNNVTGGGVACAGSTGAHVFLSASSTGIRYQLYHAGSALGLPFVGTGTAIDFGSDTAAGTYIVIATNAATSCSDTMADSAVIIVNPLPHPYLVSIENDGNYCAADSGLHITLGSSDASVKYQLYRGVTPVGGFVTGTGSGIDMGLQTVAGTYVIIGNDTATTCANNMLGGVTLNIIPLPTVHNVIGGGGYCAGGSGVDIGLDGSDPAIYYQLFDGPYSAGGLLGTGAPLDFGLQIALGNYVITGNSVITNCPNNMFGSANVFYDSLQTPVVLMQAYPGTGVGVWHIDSMRVFVTNAGPDPTYQWLINGNIIPGETNRSFTNHQFFNNDSVTCLVTASGLCGGNTTAQSLVLTLYNVGVHSVTSAGNNVQLIPNPNKGLFTVKGNLGSGTDGEVTMEVTNMMGQVLYTNKVMTQNGNIDQRIELNDNLANGMYILNIRSGSGNTIFHFVKEE